MASEPTGIQLPREPFLFEPPAKLGKHVPSGGDRARSPTSRLTIRDPEVDGAGKRDSLRPKWWGSGVRNRGRETLISHGFCLL
jgi:hypothetical protein